MKRASNPFEQILKTVSFKSLHLFDVGMVRRKMKSHRIPVVPNPEILDGWRSLDIVVAPNQYNKAADLGPGGRE